VLERIVMEGGDDLQLEPGEVVELVRRENNSTLYVRTLETANGPPMEGNVPASFLRRKCTHKQSGHYEGAVVVETLLQFSCEMCHYMIITPL